MHIGNIYDLTDTLIHEFCKLFGRYGTLKYGCDGLEFPDFLAIKNEEQTTNYYQLCLNVMLDRQVGSRYFVSASNACKIFFLTKAVLEFLEYTGKDKEITWSRRYIVNYKTLVNCHV